MKSINRLSLFLLCGLMSCNQPRVSPEQAQKGQLVSFRDKQAVASDYQFEPFLGRAIVDFREPAAKATPAVVYIRSHWASAGNMTIMGEEHPFSKFFEGPWHHFFDPFTNEPVEASASGIILSADGYIVTNNHVVNGTDSIQVVLSDQRAYQGKIIGVDKETDLALIKIDEGNLPFIRFGNSDNVEVGEWVLAVGNPLDLMSTVTAGIVSARARSVKDILVDGTIGSFIQTDAVINTGNSGGALVNVKGELIGVNTAIATSSTGAFAGYSFAIPVNIVKKVTDDLLNFGKVKRASLGLVIRDMTGTIARARKLRFVQGALVDSVSLDGAAAKAGVVVGDVIIKANEKQIANSAQLQEIVAEHRPGETIILTVVRNNSTKEIAVALRQMSEPLEVTEAGSESILADLGLEVREITEQEKKSSGLAAGLMVTKINKGKVSNYTNMRVGFIITNVDEKPVKTKADLLNVIKNKGEHTVMLEGKYPGHGGIFFYGFSI